jgi:hypothetical protein
MELGDAPTLAKMVTYSIIPPPWRTVIGAIVVLATVGVVLIVVRKESRKDSD